MDADGLNVDVDENNGASTTAVIGEDDDGDEVEDGKDDVDSKS